MAAFPVPILSRVASLLRMLGSPIDGEAQGAARALADAVEQPTMVLRDAPRPAPQRRGRRPRAAAPGSVELDFSRRVTVAAALRRGLASGRMSEWERGFAQSIVAKLQAGHGRMSARQGETLSRLLEKIEEGSAWA